MDIDFDLDSLQFATGSLNISETHHSMSRLDAQVYTVAHSAIAMSKPSSTEAHFQAQIEWGGSSDSLRWRVQGDADVRDDQGNRMGIGVRQGSDGQGDVSIKYENESPNNPPADRK